VDLFDPTIVGLQKAMSGSMLRQQLLSDNLANANTPGFKRSDVDFESALAQAFGGGAGGSSASSLSQLQFTPQQDTTSTVRADGSNVDVDTEMSDLAQNSLAYNAFTSVLTARLKIISTAIEGR
jgi:flagellar basal-body rod protein FlgB